MKNFLCGLVAASLLFLAAGAANQQTRSPQFQMSCSNSYPDVFVLNTETGQLFRYAFANPRSSATRAEMIFLETYGTQTEPAYQELERIKGKEWDSGLAY